MKRKGFTLIELLAVIVILAIIALIAVPVIMNIITSARKSAFEDTAYGLISAGEMYYASSLLENGMTSDVEFTVEDGEFVGENKLEVTGALPTSGKVKVTRDGKTAIAISNGTYCVTKGYDESKIKTDKDDGNCKLPEEQAENTLKDIATTTTEVTSVATCATDGSVCAPGTPFAIEVAPGEVKNFFVVSDSDNKVTLIMDRNIGETVAWNISGDNANGPITAINYLEEQTSGWTNILAFNYTYVDENDSKVYENITKTGIRARMITKSEINSIISNEWAYGNMDTGSAPWGYWLSCADVDNYNDAWVVTYAGAFHPSGDGILSTSFGVRPVIELLK
ncbi:MAG: prepilin-type N-terminal cleavage/methylation domain-containing protein [Firmicutes bacterium]|nr:prepilin-type N-terminal cleavage/methylation domain-containing protein [Bacillota bacterium]